MEQAQFQAWLLSQQQAYFAAYGRPPPPEYTQALVMQAQAASAVATGRVRSTSVAMPFLAPAPVAGMSAPFMTGSPGGIPPSVSPPRTSGLQAQQAYLQAAQQFAAAQQQMQYAQQMLLQQQQYVVAAAAQQQMMQQQQQQQQQQRSSPPSSSASRLTASPPKSTSGSRIASPSPTKSASQPRQPPPPQPSPAPADDEEDEEEDDPEEEDEDRRGGEEEDASSDDDYGLDDPSGNGETRDLDRHDTLHHIDTIDVHEITDTDLAELEVDDGSNRDAIPDVNIAATTTVPTATNRATIAPITVSTVPEESYASLPSDAAAPERPPPAEGDAAAEAPTTPQEPLEEEEEERIELVQVAPSSSRRSSLANRVQAAGAAALSMVSFRRSSNAARSESVDTSAAMVESAPPVPVPSPSNAAAPAPPLSPKHVNLKVRTLAGKTFPLERLALDMTYFELKELIQEKVTNIPLEEQKFLVKGKPIDKTPNATTIKEMSLVDGDVIHVVRQLSGGTGGGGEVAVTPKASPDELLTVIVPVGRRPGDRLRIHPPGRGPMLVTVPPNVHEGQPFRVQLPPLNGNTPSQLAMSPPTPPPAGAPRAGARPTPGGAGRLMAVVVPRNFRAGQTMEIMVPNRGRMRVTIPPGVRPGEPFRFRLPD